MKRYHIYGTVTGGKYLGIVEATSKAAAIDKAYNLDSATTSLCHSCDSECEDPVIDKLVAEEVEGD
jgi:hypothetical protein